MPCKCLALLFPAPRWEDAVEHESRHLNMAFQGQAERRVPTIGLNRHQVSGMWKRAGLMSGNQRSLVARATTC